MIPSFKVPAQYFYALSAHLPIDVGVDVRYRLATSADPNGVVADLHTAIDDGVIPSGLAITPAQAARRLTALGDDQGSSPVALPLIGQALVTAWLAYTPADIAPFWAGVLAPLANLTLNPPTKPQAQAHLQLIVCAIIGESDPTKLINAVHAEGITLDSVKNLDPLAFNGSQADVITFAQWKQVFAAHPNAIPAFAKVGNNVGSPQIALTEQTTAFVRRLAQFFAMPPVAAAAPTVVTTPLPTIDLPDPARDAIANFVTEYRAQPGHGAFAFGQTTTLDLPAAITAAGLVFPNDAAAAAWLVQAASAVNALYAVANVGVTDQLRFSIAESLYARGFFSAASITALTAADFQDALIGTPAYPYAAQIQANAGTPASPVPPPGGSFGPINDGTLVNCVPPPWLSPLGPVEYLHELWTLSESATCEHPEGDGIAPTLGAAITGRRGPLGDLLATAANLETALPMIDLVNEALEEVVANGSVTSIYQTAADTLAGHLLAPPGTKPNDDAVPFRHDAEVLFAAIPEHSSPGAGLAAAYTVLRNDFTAPVLPYSQPLDISRTYLQTLHTSRFATMRRFRKAISEFVLDPAPADEPVDFANYRWRYPVRIDIAREYLGISPEEYATIFTTNIPPALLAQLYGFAPGTPNWMQTVSHVSEFLKRTGLRYCEFIDLWRSGFVPFSAKSSAGNTEKSPAKAGFPLCEPCYLDKQIIVFPNPTKDLTELIVFIRLWQKLERVHGAKYTFTELADIASVLQLFDGSGSINPDFIRQLVAFQMTRDDFHLPLVDANDPTPGTGADRTHLLALFAMPPSGTPLPRKWDWAVDCLIAGIERHARAHHEAKPRASEFIKLLAKNLDPLSVLAGFDPSDPTRWWHAHPTHALRFSEIVSKIYASHFSVGEILYLFTVNDALDGDDPFPLPTEEESLDSPLDLPDDAGALSLFALRRKLLEVEISDEEAGEWTWPRIERSLRDEFGFTAPPAGVDPLLELGSHFFPDVLEGAGTTPTHRIYTQPLSAAATSPAMWNAPVDGPFHYDAGTNELSARVPLRDEAVLEKLSRIRQLSVTEATVVRELYFLPRADLAPFAFLFPTFEDADRRLIQEVDSRERWGYFQWCFARCHARCKIIAHHLAEHVAVATGMHERDHEREGLLAWRLLKQLLADENRPKPPAPWQSDSGKAPPVTWSNPSGGAFAALLGLLGTGLLGEIRREGAKAPLWRELRGPMDAFGRVRDEWNVPVPTLLPSLRAVLPPAQAGFADARNGIMVANSGVRPLGGAEGYCVEWRGVLLVEEAGLHEFFATHRPEAIERRHSERGARFDSAVAEFRGGGDVLPLKTIGDTELGSRWRVTLRRGQKSWVVLLRDWPGEGSGTRSSALPLRRGAYDISIELLRSPPAFDDTDDVHPLHAGFELKYIGPDTAGLTVALPLHRLFVAKKDATLGDGLDETVVGAAKQVLDTLYVSTLRDVRRTYQRAFKALLFARRFDFGAKSFADFGQSEIGYFLDHPDRFKGTSFYTTGGPWLTHRAYFDPDFLPVRDPYFSPTDDDRAKPSVQREQALFDQWERVFDYAALRARTARRTDQPLWLLFDDAAESPSEDPNQLLRHLAVNATYAPLLLHYDVGYSVSAPDLEDEIWAARVWRAEEWFDHVVAAFAFQDVRVSRPDLWASDHPGASGGNANLVQVLEAGFIEIGPPRRYEDLKRLNDGLRERARRAMIAYLCGPSGIVESAKELSEHLLMDVEVGLLERASRIEEGVTAVQLFERRARLGLEPGWAPSAGFALLWDRSFARFRTWQSCKRKEVYRENWIEWRELEKARRTEGFRFLESELRRSTLTVPVPGGLTYWDGKRPPEHAGLQLLQAREPSTIKLLDNQPEALNLLGTPERSARRSWLASIPGVTTPPPVVQKPENPTHVAGIPAAAQSNPPLTANGKLPFWIEAAIRLGVRFLRVPASAAPPASDPFAPRHEGGGSCCCVACGRRHEAVIDETYFWILDSKHFNTDDVIQDANANWDDDPGTDNTDLPALLSWTPRATVYLMWARMHDGEIQQPRRSSKSIAVDPSLPPELVFDGRKADSLYFSVPGASQPAGYAGTPDAGFRYDIAVDSAVVVPEVAPDPTAPTMPGGLISYPYFAYFEPGAPLVPLSFFSEAVTVACTLRSHCRYESALKWYDAFFNPLENDTRWCWESVPKPIPRTVGGDGTPVAVQPPQIAKNVVPAKGDVALATHAAHAKTKTQVAKQPSSDGNPIKVLEVVPPPAHETGACCRFSDVTDDVARQRAVTLDYLDTLLDWGDAIMRRNAPEAFQQARLVFDTAEKILGPRPITVLDENLPNPPPTVATLNAIAFGAPINPRLLALYDRVTDRLASIHAYLDARRLRDGRVHRDMPYWGDEAKDLRRFAFDGAGCATDCCDREDPCGDEDDWCCLPSPYRFQVLSPKALDLANEVRSFGAALLAAFEKGDAEYLAYVRSSHERQLAELSLAVREDAWRAADWDVQALKKSLESAQNQLQYYTGLVAGGLNSGESDYQSLTNGAIGALEAAVVSQTIATVLGPIPDIFVGTSDFTWLPLGTKLAAVFTGIAAISSTTSQILSSNASLRLTQSTWDRRLAEWNHQIDIFTIEIEQIQRQILAGERRRDSAAHDLDNTRRQIEQTREILDILRDKFTSHALYLYLQKETAALHRQMYDLALKAAHQAERAFNFERGYSARHFVSSEDWQNLREGLLSGEHLAVSLRRMDKAYCDENVREYELTKHISLRQLFPRQFLKLKTTGTCEIEIPEWLFDLDYPGHYLRRIRNVALTIPCVVGPYTGVHCRLTFLAGATRVVPWLLEPIAHCCKDEPPKPPVVESPCGCWSVPSHDGVASDPKPRSPSGPTRPPVHKEIVRRGGDWGYSARPEDLRIVRRWGAREAIATSSGQNDTGLFELNFRDERYLPFEFEGAVSRWRIELPAENNYFDMETLSDLVMHLNFTAREGGDVLRRAASEVAEQHVPDAGRRAFDVRQEMPDAWSRFRSQRREEGHAELELRLGRGMFMFLPGHRDVTITRIEVVFEAPDVQPGKHAKVALVAAHRRGCRRADHEEVREFECVASTDWKDRYAGVLDVRMGPLEWREHDLLGALRFDVACGEIRELYMVVTYETGERHKIGERSHQLGPRRDP